MEGLIITLLVVLILIVAGLATVLLIRKKDTSGSEGLEFLQRQIGQLEQTLDKRIGESSKQVHETVRSQLSESARIVREVTEGLTKLDETNRQVVSFADQLQSLQDILKNPKQRGILGEYYLETVLKNVMPPGTYELQYPFKNGEIVDAIVRVKKKIIPIDSKFSLENYNRLVEERDPVEKQRLEKVFVNDLKLRIQETAKYIRPEENTMDFAFMFIPSEGIYYDLLTNKIGAVMDESDSLIQRAAGKDKVIIVSPTSFLAYLQTVLQGLKALQIEEQAKDIQKRVGDLGKHLKGYETYMQKMGNALATTVNHYNAAGKELGKIDKDVLRITGDAPGLEPMALAKPDQEDE